MSKFLFKAVFRLRERSRHFLLDLPRMLRWRAMGLRAGPRTRLPKVHITWPHQVAFGADCQVEHGSYFKFDGIYAPGPTLRFGDRVFIGAGCEFNIRAGLEVGADALIASGCYFVDHDHGFSTRREPIARQADGVEAPIAIGDDVWLGAHVVVLKGVTIGRGAIVAAGSVVTRSIGPYEIWGGVPARKLRERPQDAVPA
jgi:acetyltransferase-like isoleucine patch superfamily enzyme